MFRMLRLITRFCLLLLFVEIYSTSNGHAKSITKASSDTTVISLNGADWWIHDDPQGYGVQRKMFVAKPLTTDGWIPATVPGNIQADLEIAHQLTPLWYGAGDPHLAEVPLKDWWYRKDFYVPESMKSKDMRLLFAGVDDSCDVYVNGHYVGSNAGMFLRFNCNVTEWINPGQINHLAVRIEHMPKVLQQYITASDGSVIYTTPGTPDYFPTSIVKTREVLNRLKSTTNFGWDWGINIWTLGIWKNVKLEATGPAHIKWVQVQTNLKNNYRRAVVRTNLTISSKEAIKAHLIVRILGHEADSLEKAIDLNLTPGLNHVNCQITLDHPALWWPNGQGDQPLYVLYISLKSDKGEYLDMDTTHFGVRDIHWEQVQGAPADFANPFRLLVNGRPIRMLGSNMVPPDLLFGRIKDRGTQLLYRAKVAGINTMRIWGGGVILPEKMYDLADKLGIMLIQEFPISIDPIQTNKVFLSNLKKTAKNIIRQIRNHPSIVEWTGGNELSWRYDSQHPAYLILKHIFQQEDDRIFRPSSPITGSAHGAYWFEAQNSDYAFYNDRNAMFAGEFGTQSPANLHVWLKTIPPSDRWPIHGFGNPILLRKNVVQAVFSTKLWLDKPAIETLFGPPPNLSTMIREGQLLGADGLRYNIDAQRQRGTRIGGMLTWDFNEPWPNGAGSYMVDYYGQPLMNFDFVKQAYAPISLSLHYNSMFYDQVKGLQAKLMLVSDAPKVSKNLHWYWLARDRRGKVFDHGSGVATISPQQVTTLATLSIHPPTVTARGPIFLELKLTNTDGHILTERVEFFAAEGMSAPLAGLLNGNFPRTEDNAPSPLNPSPLDRSVRRTHLHLASKSLHGKGSNQVLKLTVTNTGSMTALFCRPSPMLAYRSDLYISNRNVCIPPHESRTFTIRSPHAEAGDLSLSNTGWQITCWNAPDIIVQPSANLLLYVGRRDQMCREFKGALDSTDIDRGLSTTKLTANPAYMDPSKVPYLFDKGDTLKLHFTVAAGQVNKPARLLIYTSDQSKYVPALITITMNNNSYSYSCTLPRGLGLQSAIPAQLAFCNKQQITIPAGMLKGGTNTLDIHVTQGWLTWDAIDLLVMPVDVAAKIKTKQLQQAIKLYKK